MLLQIVDLLLHLVHLRHPLLLHRLTGARCKYDLDVDASMYV